MAVLWNKFASSVLHFFLGQNSSYLPVSVETLQTEDVKGIQYFYFWCLTFKCQKVILSPGGLDAL